MTGYRIRPAKPKDMGAVLKLIRELAAFEREPDAVEIGLEDLVRDGFGPVPRFQCYVAEEEGKILAMALCYPRYSTWKGLVVHLEDLVVTEAARRRGIGGALLTAVIRYARDRGAKRASWEVLDWNEGAIRFYASRGARILTDWNLVQLDARGIDRYLERYEDL